MIGQNFCAFPAVPWERQKGGKAQKKREGGGKEKEGEKKKEGDFKFLFRGFLFLPVICGTHLPHESSTTFPSISSYLTHFPPFSPFTMHYRAAEDCQKTVFWRSVFSRRANEITPKYVSHTDMGTARTQTSRHPKISNLNRQEKIEVLWRRRRSLECLVEESFSQHKSPSHSLTSLELAEYTRVNNINLQNTDMNVKLTYRRDRFQKFWKLSWLEPFSWILRPPSPRRRHNSFH